MDKGKNPWAATIEGTKSLPLLVFGLHIMSCKI